MINFVSLQLFYIWKYIHVVNLIRKNPTVEFLLALLFTAGGG